MSPGRYESLKNILNEPGLAFNKLKISSHVYKTLLDAWGGKSASRRDICNQVQNLLTVMCEEFDEYVDTIDILHLGHQDAFFRTISRRVFWTRNVNQKELATFIHCLIDAREHFLVSRYNRRNRFDTKPIPRLIQHFMDLYQQRGKREKMKAMEQRRQREEEVFPKTTVHDKKKEEKEDKGEKEEEKGITIGSGKVIDLPIRNKSGDVVGPTKKKDLNIRNKSGRMVGAPKGPFLIPIEQYRLLVAREKENKMETQQKTEKAVGI